MQNLIFSLNVTLPVFLTIVIGYILRRCNFISAEFVKVCNSFNFKVTLPALLFLDLYNSDFQKVWNTQYVLFCFLSTLICIGVILVFSLLFFKDKSIIGEFVQASYRGSAAVLGLAFIQNIYGQATIAPLMIIGSVPLYNVMSVIILCFTSSYSLTRQNKEKQKQLIQKSIKGVLTNPIIISIVLGILVSLSGIHLPFLMTKTCNNLAVMATPLALIGLGGGFEGKAALKMLPPAFGASFIRLILQCAIFLPLAVKLGFRQEEMVSLLIMLGAPTTPSCYIMATNLGHKGVLTSSCVVMTTLLGSFTLTFWLFIMKSFGII